MEGAGRHWEPGNVNLMLALREELCLDLPSSTALRKGRNDGQKRWGRRTFSQRVLQDRSVKN
jgi:hypothetical protein